MFIWSQLYLFIHSSVLITFIFQIRPCEIYRDEYNECKYWKSRFHQYFIHGHKVDCSSWQKDFKNCEIWQENKSKDAYVRELIL